MSTVNASGEGLIASMTWLERHVTLERVLWLLAIVLFLVAWNRGLYLLYGMFAFLLAALTMSYVGAYWQLRQLKAEVLLPSEAHNGLDVNAKILLQGRGQLLSVRLVDKEGFTDASPIPIDRCEVRREQMFQIRFGRRGLFQLSEVVVTSYYPFGLVHRQRRITVPLVQTIVYPKVHAIKQLPTELQQGAHIQGDMPQQRQHGHEEFSMVRDYRRGDEVKHIHWRLSAKRQSWVVKEFDSTRNPTMAVLLHHDLSWHQKGYDAIEHMLEIVASLATVCAAQGYGLRIQLDHQNHYDVQPFEQDLQSLMYALSLWEPESSVNDERKLMGQLAQYSVLMVFSALQDAPAHPLPLLTHQHLFNVRFDRKTYPAQGLTVPLRRQQKGRETLVQVSSTSQLWGLF